MFFIKLIEFSLILRVTISLAVGWKKHLKNE